MTTQFLNFYISNLEVLSTEIKRSRCSIQRLSDKTKALTSEVKQRLLAFFAEKQHDDDAKLNYQIKSMYLLIRQIQKCQDEKRSHARQACDILDRYFESLNTKLKTASTYHNFNDIDEQVELFRTLLSIKFTIDQPARWNTDIIDLMEKMNDELAENSKDSGQNIESSLLQCSDGTIKSKTNDSDEMHRIDNLQDFTERLREMKRCRTNGLSSTGTKTLSNKEQETSSPTSTEEEKGDEDDDEEDTCYCRKESSGRMVACDNSKCKIQWYHFECVGLYVAPDGLWFCPSCIIFENM